MFSGLKLMIHFHNITYRQRYKETRENSGKQYKYSLLTNLSLESKILPEVLSGITAESDE
jgi:hypothetical protein